MRPRRRGVYPRAGGGTYRACSRVRSTSGLSPRGRGNRGPGPRVHFGGGSIPARAGEPSRRSGCWWTGRVYPRAGGGTGIGIAISITLWGLSPRGRGNPAPDHRTRSRRRSIPARAGEPATAGEGSPSSRVYPRAGGGTPSLRRRGSMSRGLSPRGRGNPRRMGRPRAVERSIPARAGEPWPWSCLGCPNRVYPRAGGGTVALEPRAAVTYGLSPRGRGNPPRARRARRDPGSIPARAGEPARSRPPGRPRRVYPRAGGGTRGRGCRPEARAGLSPRGRGNHILPATEYHMKGSIPARAGEP